MMCLAADLVYGDAVPVGAGAWLEQRRQEGRGALGGCRAWLSGLMEERLCQREIKKPNQVLGH